MVEQCGTAWRNSVAQFAGTVWHSLVEPCGTVWWNSGTVQNGMVEQ